MCRDDRQRWPFFSHARTLLYVGRFAATTYKPLTNFVVFGFWYCFDQEHAGFDPCTDDLAALSPGLLRRVFDDNLPALALSGFRRVGVAIAVRQAGVDRV